MPSTDHGRTIRIPVPFVESLNRLSPRDRNLEGSWARPAPRGAGPADRTASQQGPAHPRIQHGSLPRLKRPSGRASDLADFVEDRQELSPQEGLVDRDLPPAAREKALGSLTLKEQQILRLRFRPRRGKGGAPRWKRSGWVRDVTRERIRQIEVEGLRMLHHSTRGKGLHALGQNLRRPFSETEAPRQISGFADCVSTSPPFPAALGRAGCSTRLHNGRRALASSFPGSSLRSRPSSQA